MFPDAKLAIGPPTEDGFYYDFMIDSPFTPEDLEEIEGRMRVVISEDHAFEYAEYPREQMNEMNVHEPLKLEVIAEIPEGEPISTYTHRDFEDLCAGPHVESTGRIPAFKLLNVAGAYWRGDENRPMLQRIYGTAFESQGSARRAHRKTRTGEAARPQDGRTRSSTCSPYTTRPAPGSSSGIRKALAFVGSSKTSGRVSTTAGAMTLSIPLTSGALPSGRPVATWRTSKKTCSPRWTWRGRTTI